MQAMIFYCPNERKLSGPLPSYSNKNLYSLTAPPTMKGELTKISGKAEVGFVIYFQRLPFKALGIFQLNS